MEGILIDYHIVFIILAVIVFLFSLMCLFFGDKTKEKVIAGWICIMFNLNLCLFNFWGFLSINLYGFDSDGVYVANSIADMQFGWAIFFGLMMVNIGLLFYIPVILREIAKKEEIAKVSKTV